MRRSLAFLLITLVLFNTIGYYAVLVGWQVQQDRRMVAHLQDEDYDVSREIALRIPIAIPYQYDNPDFVPVTGKFQHEGKTYRLIKQRYAQDTLTVICILDHRAQQIQDAMSRYVNTFRDHHADDDQTPLPNFIKEYIPFVLVLTTVCYGWMIDVRHLAHETRLTSHFSQVIYSPPKV